MYLYMLYQGSKRRLAPYLLPIILKNRQPDQWYIEPFAGGMNMIDKVQGNRLANDNNPYLIAMWEALVYRNWTPPSFVSEEEYRHIKYNKQEYPPELVGFVGIQCSFGAQFFVGYAKRKKDTYNYAMAGRNKLLKQIELLKGTIFTSMSYNEVIMPPNSIIYCDPPYKTTRHKYNYSIDYDIFWEWCRVKSSEGHTVYISEHTAPNDFTCVWESELSSILNAVIKTKAIEKLFIFNTHL